MASASGVVPRPPPRSAHYPGARHPGATPLHTIGAWNPCCACHFSSLPDALLGAILSYAAGGVPDLLAAASVCTRWNYVVESDPTLWRAVAAPPCSGVGLARLLARQRPGAVHALSLRRLRASSPEELAALGGLTLPRLTELDLAGCRQVDPDALVSFVLRHGRQLRVLVLDGLTRLTDAHVAALLAGCPALKRLSLAQCRQLTDDVLVALAAAPAARHLVALNVTGCSGDRKSVV